MKTIYKKNRKINRGKTAYQCSVCSEVFNWDKESSWYGSYKQIEEAASEVRYYCSDTCKESDKQNQEK